MNWVPDIQSENLQNKIREIHTEKTITLWSSWQWQYTRDTQTGSATHWGHCYHTMQTEHCYMIATNITIITMTSCRTRWRRQQDKLIQESENVRNYHFNGHLPRSGLQQQQHTVAAEHTHTHTHIHRTPLATLGRNPVTWLGSGRHQPLVYRSATSRVDIGSRDPAWRWRRMPPPSEPGRLPDWFNLASRAAHVAPPIIRPRVPQAGVMYPGRRRTTVMGARLGAPSAGRRLLEAVRRGSVDRGTRVIFFDSSGAGVYIYNSIVDGAKSAAHFCASVRENARPLVIGYSDNWWVNRTWKLDQCP